eukprot:gene1372-1493_t
MLCRLSLSLPSLSLASLSRRAGALPNLRNGQPIARLSLGPLPLSPVNIYFTSPFSKENSISIPVSDLRKFFDGEGTPCKSQLKLICEDKNHPTDNYVNSLLLSSEPQDFADFRSALNADIVRPSLQTAEFNQIIEKDVLKSQIAFQLFKLATEKLSVKPDQRTFDLVLTKLAAEGLWDQFFYVSGEMHYRGLFLSDNGVQTVIAAFRKIIDQGQVVQNSRRSTSGSLDANSWAMIFDYFEYARKYQFTFSLFVRMKSLPSSEKILRDRRVLQQIGMMGNQLKDSTVLLDLFSIVGKEHLDQNQKCCIFKHDVDSVEASLANFMSSILNSPNAKVLVRSNSSLSDVAALYIAHLLGKGSFVQATELWESCFGLQDDNENLKEIAARDALTIIMKCEKTISVVDAECRAKFCSHVLNSSAKNKLNVESGHASERRSNFLLSSDLMRHLVNIFYILKMGDDLEFVIRLALEQDTPVDHSILSIVLDKLLSKHEYGAMIKILRSDKNFDVWADMSMDRKPYPLRTEAPGVPKEHQFSLSSSVFSRALFAYLKMNEVDVACKLLAESRSRVGYSPSLSDFSMALKLLLQNKHYQTARDMFFLLERSYGRKEIYSHGKLVHAMLDVCAAGGQGNTARDTFKLAMDCETELNGAQKGDYDVGPIFPCQSEFSQFESSTADPFNPNHAVIQVLVAFGIGGKPNFILAFLQSAATSKNGIVLTDRIFSVALVAVKVCRLKDAEEEKYINQIQELYKKMGEESSQLNLSKEAEDELRSEYFAHLN